MKFRKRHREETAEVFTDSLNDILFILLMFFLIVATLSNPNVVKVGLPRGTKDVNAKQNIKDSIVKKVCYHFLFMNTHYLIELYFFLLDGTIV